MIKILLTMTVSLAFRAQAQIGWTYQQCVDAWGEPTSHITLNDCPEPDVTRPLFIFHRTKGYVEVEIHGNRVIKEVPTDSAEF